MAQILYKLWLDGAVVGEWTDPVDMRQGVSDYVEANPDELHLLNLTGFTSSKSKAAFPAFSLKSDEILTYLEDIEFAGE
jgi:hypothetical protein